MSSRATPHDSDVPGGRPVAPFDDPRTTRGVDLAGAGLDSRYPWGVGAAQGEISGSTTVPGGLGASTLGRGTGAVCRFPDLPTVDGGHPRQRLTLTVPPGGDHPRPVVLFVHGGAWRSGDRDALDRADGPNFAALHAVLLAQGWATASVGYRLSGDAPMPAQLDDVVAARAWVTRHAAEYGLDARRVAVIGESAGGHLAQFLGTTRGVGGGPDGVVGVVSLYGVSDLARVVPDRVAAGCGPGEAGPGAPEAALLGVDPTSPEGAEAAAAASPITFVSRHSAPTLFLHGTADCVVPHAQSERAAAASRRCGVPADLVLLDGIGHASPVFATSPDTQHRIVDFLRRVFT